MLRPSIRLALLARLAAVLAAPVPQEITIAGGLTLTLPPSHAPTAAATPTAHSQTTQARTYDTPDLSLVLKIAIPALFCGLIVYAFTPWGPIGRIRTHKAQQAADALAELAREATRSPPVVRAASSSSLPAYAAQAKAGEMCLARGGAYAHPSREGEGEDEGREGVELERDGELAQDGRVSENEARRSEDAMEPGMAERRASTSTQGPTDVDRRASTSRRPSVATLDDGRRGSTTTTGRRRSSGLLALTRADSGTSDHLAPLTLHAAGLGRRPTLNSVTSEEDITDMAQDMVQVVRDDGRVLSIDGDPATVASIRASLCVEEPPAYEADLGRRGS